ncbi:sarcinarray family MAST domain-containing protein [Methanococcoides sp. SA1]|nr:sarcinarray family MAST domain-containing protein [Methanococcoides sp. SA1]
MIRKIIITLIILASISTNALAYNPYGEVYTYESYYNSELLGLEPAKPILKINEPFTLEFEITVYQKCFVNVALTEVGKNDFLIIKGPTEVIEEYTKLVTLEPNSTQRYEWLIAPTDNWAGGTMPLNIHYTILDPSSPEPIVNSEFTAVLPYISTEYYEGEATAPETPAETENKQTPAFTLPSALLAITLLATYNRHRK